MGQANGGVNGSGTHPGGECTSAAPHEPVVAVCGDGCLLMSLAELRTAVQEQCDNLKIVVFNNGGFTSMDTGGVSR